MSEWFEILSRLGAAALVGAGIGLNRHLHHKSTGLRTLSLVACGSAGLVLAALHAAGGASHVVSKTRLRHDAMSRVIQGLMTGVGFIGAGVVIRNPAGDKIHGLTTAAAVWMTAALGALSTSAGPHADGRGQNFDMRQNASSLAEEHKGTERMHPRSS